jgi:hypothetical protein
MCTILSELNKHDKAAIHAKIALKLLLMELFTDIDKGTPEGKQEIDQGNIASTANNPLPADRIAVLSIAYHNLAVQQEFLHQFNESLQSYAKAYKVVENHLGSNHPLAKSLLDSYNQAKSKFANKLKLVQNSNTTANTGAGGSNNSRNNNKPKAKANDSKSSNSTSNVQNDSVDSLLNEIF